VYLIDPTLRREYQTLPLRATGSGDAVVEWRVDGRPVGRGDGGASIEWPLAPGRHVVTVHDGEGRQAEAAVVVK